MDDEDFLDAVVADNASNAAPEPIKVEVVAEPVQPEPEVLLLDDPATPPTPEKVEAPEPMRNDDAADGRLAALLDERDKRKAAEAELQRIRAAQQQQQPVQRPDEYEDPDGAREFDQAQVSGQLYQINLRYSERLARIEHGAEKVDAAKAWAMAKCDADPLFNAKIAQSDDPVGLAVTEYQRDEIASKVTPSDFAQFQAWKQAQGQLQQAATPPPNTASAIPPKSLASAPSAGNMLTEPVQDDGEIFDEVIPKR